MAFILHSLLKKPDVEKIFPLLELCSILAKNPKAVLGPPAHPSLPPGMLNLLFLSLIPIASNDSDSLIRSDGSDLTSPLPRRCSVSRDRVFSMLAIFLESTAAQFQETGVRSRVSLSGLWDSDIDGYTGPVRDRNRCVL
jgi:hypothetical protein